ncbi:MAG: glycosyltransferase, partial [Chloroflexi bacterium]|nr:glycosyltransferase [Chloroflexota bacterium]
RKGVDIATEAVVRLNDQGIPAELTVCATAGPAAPYVTYVGPFRKSDPAQLAQYAELYRRAHLLIHPARFEPAGIVPGEAAAFGTPTITNDAGGLGTTVRHDVSGLVLPRHSPAETYVAAITNLVNQPDCYYALCHSARKRYEAELNWRSAGQTVEAVFQEAAHL